MTSVLGKTIFLIGV